MSKQSFPLKWPDGWVRTRPQQRQRNSTWKYAFGRYRDDLIDELRRLGARDVVLSTDIPVNKSNGLPREGFNPPDPGVAVYFQRGARAIDWQDVLGVGPAPSSIEVERKVRELSKRYYPDVAGTGDAEMFRQVVKARDAARNFFAGRPPSEGHPYVLACDKFVEVRLNMHAIALTVNSLRQIERCGASSMLERAFRGFQAALPAHASEGAA